MAEDTYSVTQLGAAIAQDVYVRFIDGDETLEEIAESHGMNAAEVSLLMTMVFNGGTVTVETDDK